MLEEKRMPVKYSIIIHPVKSNIVLYYQVLQRNLIEQAHMHALALHNIYIYIDMISILKFLSGCLDFDPMTWSVYRYNWICIKLIIISSSWIGKSTGFDEMDFLICMDAYIGFLNWRHIFVLSRKTMHWFIQPR